MTNTFNKKTTMFLVDFENNTIINYGESEEMVTQMDQSHGNLFVVSYENLNKKMQGLIDIEEMLQEAYKEEDN
jgi:hypothetical protein